jgi:flavin-dependent dehydrogenase
LRSLGVLEQVGLGDLPRRRGAIPLTHFCVAANGRRATVALPGGFSLSRPSFDAGLVEEAIAAGAAFLPGTLARLAQPKDEGERAALPEHGSEGRDKLAVCPHALRIQIQGVPPHRELHLRQDMQEAIVSAKLIIAADGLGGHILADENAAALSIAANSRIGSGVVADEFPAFYDRGTIFMACGPGGYVGLVRLEDGRLDVATAFDPVFVKRAGGLGAAAATILAEAGFPPISDLEALPWRGTPLLTRRALRPAAERLFAVGDAAGYIEPFTGEGISWALASGVAVAPLAHRACLAWDETLAARWCDLYHHTVSRRQRVCRIVAEVLRRPRLTGWLVAGIARLPALANPVVRYLNFVPRTETA